MQNFPSSTVVGQLRKAKDLTDKGETAFTIKSFNGMKAGTVEVPGWVAPSELGRYYIFAYSKEFPALFAFSHAFDVVAKPTHPNRRW